MPPGSVDLVLTNVGAPGKACSAMNSPNAGPHMGFIRVALVDPERRKLSQRQIADLMRELLTRNYPGVEFLQWPGGLVASVFSNGYLAPLVVEVSGDSLEELDAPMLARLIAARLPALEGEWLIVPVPLHRMRLWRRGFNQAALLARELAKQTGGEVLVDALVRRKPTPTLGGLGR